MKASLKRANDARAVKRASRRASLTLAVLVGLGLALLALVDAPPADAARMVLRTIRLEGYVGSAPGGAPVQAKWSVDAGEKSIALEVTRLQIVAGPGTASDVVRALKPYRAAAFRIVGDEKKLTELAAAVDGNRIELQGTLRLTPARILMLDTLQVRGSRPSPAPSPK